MMGGFGMGSMGIIGIIVAVAVILLVKGYLSPPRKDGEPPEASALEILEKRYARGEIDTAEFEQKKQVLMQ